MFTSKKPEKKSPKVQRSKKSIKTRKKNKK